MESASNPGRTTVPGGPASASPNRRCALNVASVYQDAPTREWAAQICDQVTHLVGKESLHHTGWELNRLSDAEVLVAAASSAMQAEVIVVSIYDAKELPGDFYAWIDTWLAHRRLSAGTLVALVGVADRPSAQFNHAQDYLRAIARKGRLDFLLRERWLPAASRGFFCIEKIEEKANAATPVMEEALRHDHNGCGESGMDTCDNGRTRNPLDDAPPPKKN